MIKFPEFYCVHKNQDGILTLEYVYPRLGLITDHTRYMFDEIRASKTALMNRTLICSRSVRVSLERLETIIDKEIDLLNNHIYKKTLRANSDAS